QGVLRTIESVGPPSAESDLGRPSRLVARLTQHPRADRRAVHEPEMMWVDGILSDDLRVHLDALEPGATVGSELVIATRRDMITENVESVGQPPARLGAGDVVPDVDGVMGLDDGVGTDTPAAIRAFLVGNPHVSALPVPDPAVEQTLDTVVDNASAVREA